MSTLEFTEAIIQGAWPILIVGLVGTALLIRDIKRWLRNRRKKVYKVSAWR